MDNSADKKKRKALEAFEVDDVDNTLIRTKKARPSNSATPLKAAPDLITPCSSESKPAELPDECTRIISIHNALEGVMSAALATAQISPDPDTGRVHSVINHLSFEERGLGVRLSVEDLQKLCWVWEWDGERVPKNVASLSSTMANSSKKKQNQSSDFEDDSDYKRQVGSEDRNPFLITPVNGDEDENTILHLPTISKRVPKDYWVRGGCGFCISATTHVTRLDRISPAKRVPAYGIGIEVEWSHEDVVGRRVGGMNAVARWSGAADRRKVELHQKLATWIKLTSKQGENLPIPLANLPPLAKPPTTLKLPHLATPRKLTFPTTRVGAPLAATPSSHTELAQSPSRDADGFAIPFPVMTGNRLVTPHGPRPGEPCSGSSGIPSPSSGRSRGIRTPSFGKAAAKLAAACTPSSDGRTAPTSDHRDRDLSVPETPTKASSSVPRTAETPTSARRAALYERVKAKSESE